jgi:DNA end-binding protein Ku
VNQKTGHFDPAQFEDHYEAALVELINQKRAGRPITPKTRPAAGGAVDLMEALRKSLSTEAPKTAPRKKPRKTTGQKEMLLPIDGEKPARESGAKKASTKLHRKTA